MLISNKLVSLLTKFSKHDLNSFKKFVASPFHNENQELIQLFALLDQYFRSTEKERAQQPLEKVKIWQQLFGKQPYKDVKMRRLCSDLIKLVYSFLAYKTYQQDGIAEQLHLVKALRQLSLKKHFEGTQNQLSTALEKNEYKNADYHLSNYRLNYNQFNFPKDVRTKLSLFNNLEKADYHLECYFIIKKLENYCNYIGYKQHLSFEANISLPPSFMEYIETSNFIKEPFIKAYFLVAKMLTKNDNPTYFLSLKKHLENKTEYFTLQALDIFYIHLKNYCIAKINTGDTAYLSNLFEIFQTLLKEKVILKDGIISPQNYKNIVTVGLQLQEFDWVVKFIKDYTNFLPKANRENARVFNLAKVYFSQKKYDQVIEQLREVEYKNHVYALGGKLILLRTYYELKEYIALDSLIDSFRIYIRRNKIISREVQQQYLNMLRFVKKLSSTMPGDKKAIEKIRAQIDKCKALAAKKWILEKVAELA